MVSHAEILRKATTLVHQIGKKWMYKKTLPSDKKQLIINMYFLLKDYQNEKDRDMKICIIKLLRDYISKFEWDWDMYRQFIS